MTLGTPTFRVTSQIYPTINIQSILDGKSDVARNVILEVDYDVFHRLIANWDSCALHLTMLVDLIRELVARIQDINIVIHNEKDFLLLPQGRSTDIIPPSTADPATGVSSKDVTISTDPNALVAEAAKVVAVSVNYRKAPENPIPVAYEDSWATLHWAFSHSGGTGPDNWLNRLLGAALIHPYIWGVKSIGSEAVDPERKASVDRLWPFICPTNPDNDDPCVNPVVEGAPSLAGLGCGRVLVCVAEKDVLKDRGWMYYEAVARSGWPGMAEIMETEGEGHVFHLNALESQKAKDLIQLLADFLNRDMPPWFS
ncbi:hypothetical protein CRG98_009919 [Punica granatum]|uniref:Alpha/beta hydrolase fold-3 domain-containing protein n=1 Tax=Punica granatum TaxID=22663 RepID=A0A2I0KN99_PUNGR|nr:hypothetical protein CRG98_009919 [Punica granatum]